MNKIKNLKFIQNLKRVFNNKFFGNTLVRLAFLSILLNIIVESLGRHSVLNAFVHMGTRPGYFLYNCLLIFMTLTIACFFKKRIFVTTFISIVWIGLGVTDYVLSSVRKTPFTAPDLLNIKDGMKVMNKYFKVYQMVILGLIILAAMAVIVLIAIKSPKIKEKINYWKCIVITMFSLGAILLISKIGMTTGLLATNFGNIRQAYYKYGFGYCFSCSLFDSGISKPKGYSQDSVNKLVEEVETSVPNVLDNSTEVDPEADKPNIIFVQLESEFDPTLVKGLEFSEDPIPNLRKLYKNYSSGYLSVPVFGAGTANTEFEVITGMNLDDFGPGEYPYKTVLRNSACESVCYYLKADGYTTNAIHDNEGDFYHRNTVFSRLGFDTFTSMEYMQNIEQNPTGWAKDSCLTKEITGILDFSSGPDFIYTISVQGHGDYPEDTSNLDLPIKVSNNEVTGNPNGFEYYVNQVHEMDEFVGELIETLSKRNEKTVVVFYGDHLPTFDVTDDDLENGDIYQTEYVIWDNFGLDKEDGNYEAYQISSVVLSKLGLAGGVISKYHMTCMKQEDQEEYLSNLTLLEYDILYGDCDSYNGVSPYTITNLKMGYRNIRISSVNNITEHAIIYGQNFTPYSQVTINGEKVDTIFENDKQLILDNMQIEDEDQIAVVQAAADGDILSSTSIYVYHK